MHDKANYPDWLIDDEKPEPTLEETKQAWRRFIETDFRGWSARFENRGGDMWSLEGIIDAVEQRDSTIVLKLRTVTVFGDPEETEEPIEKLPKDEIILSVDILPNFGEEGGEVVVLPGGAANYEELDIGFLYPPAAKA